MATYIRIDYKAAQLLEQNRQQVDANRINAFEAIEQKQLRNRIQVARQGQELNVRGQLRRGRREELAAAARPKLNSYCVIEIIGGQIITGELPLSGLLPDDQLFYPMPDPIYDYTARVTAFRVQNTQDTITDLGLTTTISANVQAVYKLMKMGKVRGSKPPSIPENQEYSSAELFIPAAYPRSDFFIFYRSEVFAFNPAIDTYYTDFGTPYIIPRYYTVNRGPYSIFVPLTINIYPTQSKTINDLLYGETEQIKRAELANIMSKSTLDGTKQSKEASYNITEQDTRIQNILPKQTLAILKGSRYLFKYILQ